VSVAWRAEIERRLDTGSGLEFSQAQFAQAVGVGATNAALDAFLEALVVSGGARQIYALVCPSSSCRRVLDPAAAPYASCPYCETDYGLEGMEVLSEVFYRLEGEISRDIRWMIVIHGMNSRAAWQEEFSWQIANRLRHSAPILIYKYGWATIDVLLANIHKQLARRLGERMRIAVRQAKASGRPNRPDIIAHSFGTRLLSLILEDPQFDELKFGRVITAGSIVRPDYNWDRHVAAGKVEAVLNHMGGKDRAVPFAQFMIPGTGPGGTKGYGSANTLNVRDRDFAHSDFFQPENLRALIGEGGLWHSFLTHPPARLKPEGLLAPDPSWRPAPVLLRTGTRLIGYLIFCVSLPLSWLRRRLDP
jgi:hypothetical protein